MTVFDDKDLQKLSVNALIGMFGRRDNSFIDSQVCEKDNEAEIASIYTKYQRPFINDVSCDYSIITEKVSIDKLENAYPIYAQILDCEAIELYKMVQLLNEQKDCIPVCVKTDAVVYYAKQALDISPYFWKPD